jgi:predicted metalloprotease
MRWTPGDRSNVEDDRGGSGFGVRGGVPLGIGGVLLLLVLSWATGTNLFSLFDTPGGAPATPGGGGPVSSNPAEEREVDFVDAVMKDVQATWSDLLPNRYEATRAVLFRDSIQSACGFAQSATGPFYCRRDARVYLDLGFFQELRDRFGAPGDFAQAYVLAHEVGHHVQQLTGVDAEAPRDHSAAEGANSRSVRIELQADCFAGVWGHTAAQAGRAARGQVELEPGDVEEGLQAAAAIGDDRLQRMTTGHVAPERFTHGTSAQRVEWFTRGFTTGMPQSCDTFAR